MIDLENARKEFFEYTKKYDNNEPAIKRKIEHSIRTMNIMRRTYKISIFNRVASWYWKIWAMEKIWNIYGFNKYWSWRYGGIHITKR